MHVDWTVNLGNLIPIATFLILIVYRMSRLETKVDVMWKAFTDEINMGGRRNYLRNKL